ncbi:MAG: hypothetical protein ACYTG0_44070 [Planctomycetota bacterium]
MRPKETPAKALQRLFRRKPVVDLETVCRALKTRSRMTVFRRLKDFNYLSSYSHAGRYYTLAELPRFDEHGLWLYHGIGFSKAGTLKNTVVLLVEAAEAGQTHPELEQLLHVRVHNTLLSLVREEHIGRERIERMYLYVSVQPERAQEQIVTRRNLLAEKREAVPLTPATIIEILIETIRLAQVQVAPAKVAKRLATRGIVVTAQQVEEILARYGIDAGKKTAD